MSDNSAQFMKAPAQDNAATSQGAASVQQVSETCAPDAANKLNNQLGEWAPSTPKAKSSKPTSDVSVSETNTKNGEALNYDEALKEVESVAIANRGTVMTQARRLLMARAARDIAVRRKLSSTQAVNLMTAGRDYMFHACEKQAARDAHDIELMPEDLKPLTQGSTAPTKETSMEVGKVDKSGTMPSTASSKPQSGSNPAASKAVSSQVGAKPSTSRTERKLCKIERKLSERDNRSDVSSKSSRASSRGDDAKERARERASEKKETQQRAAEVRGKHSLSSAGRSSSSDEEFTRELAHKETSLARADDRSVQKQENREGATRRLALKEAGMSRNTVLTDDQKRDFPVDASGGLSGFTAAMMPGIELSSRTRNTLTLAKLQAAFLPRYSGRGFVSTHAPPVWALWSHSEYYHNEVYEVEDERMEVQLETKSKVTYGIIGRAYTRAIGPKLATFFTLSFGVAWGCWRRSWRAGVRATLLAASGMAVYWPFGSFVRNPQKDVSIHVAHLAKAVRDQIDVSKALVAQKTMSTHYYPSDLTIMYCNHAMRAQWLADMRMSASFACAEPLAAGKHQQHKAKVLDTGYRWNKDNDKWNDTRAWTMTSCSLVDTSRANVPAINPNNLCEARQKRVLFKSEPMAPAIYELMRDVLRVMTHGIARSEGSPDYVEYATEMALRKGLNRAQREALIGRAVEIEGMDDAAILETLRKGLKTVKFFVKDEPYLKEEANLRFIISPADDVKIIFGAALRPIEEQTYYETRLAPCLIKGKEPNEIREIMLEDFSEPAYYLETDYSNFESTIAYEELSLEYEFYKSRTSDTMSRDIISCVEAANLRSAKVTNFQYGAMQVPCMRYSGMPNTALGNALLNFVNIRVAERRAGVLCQRLLVEGDDAIMRFGTDADRNAFFTALREGRFVAHECQFANVGTDLSFCGYKLDDSFQLQPTDEQVAKLGLIFSRQEPSLELCKARMFAKILSYSYRYPEWRELREIALYIEDEYQGVDVHSRSMWKVLNEDWYRSSGVMRDRYREMVRSVVETGTVSHLLRG